ncbi:IS66-like element accessory protein TnpA [Sphingobium sp. R-7]|jgi:transposase|uniref:IS66-like element accessory protein TnpA n=1 Tax=Sphingobium sp. R-7 TaxID=3375449 RepID=UPI00398ACA4E
MGDVTTFESSFESNGNGRARPMEVIPAGRERRQWTPEAKARIIAESMQVRANVAEIARRNDILPQQLYAWRREARERMESDDAPAFVPAMVEEPKAQGNGAEIRINIKGMTIRIPDGVTADHIERVLLAVQVST